MPNLKILEYKTEIIALGMRNLISNGIMPVNRAYMKFNLKSLLPSSQANAIKNIQTQPNNKGHKTLLSLKIICILLETQSCLLLW